MAYRHHYRHRRRSGFGGPAPIIQLTGQQKNHPRKCAHCARMINVGEDFVQLRIRKVFIHACSVCHQSPKPSRRFHAACAPAQADWARVMGYDPSTQQQHQPVPPPPSSAGTVPPPPKPKTAQEVTLDALVALEAALVAQVKQRQRQMTPELDAKFKTFQNIKARILRPGTPGEGEAATHVGLKKIVELVFS